MPDTRFIEHRLPITELGIENGGREGIEAMGHEEAAYWLGMAVHRKHPRWVLAALRFLLTDPKR